MPEIVSKQTEAKREAWTDSPSYSQKEVCVCVCVCVCGDGDPGKLHRSHLEGLSIKGTC